MDFIMVFLYAILYVALGQTLVLGIYGIYVVIIKSQSKSFCNDLNGLG